MALYRGEEIAALKKEFVEDSVRQGNDSAFAEEVFELLRSASYLLYFKAHTLSKVIGDDSCRYFHKPCEA